MFNGIGLQMKDFSFGGLEHNNMIPEFNFNSLDQNLFEEDEMGLFEFWIEDIAI